MSQEPNSYAFFANTSCKYYPCHSGADMEHFNCLFCYCPLYALGEDCGGNFTYALGGLKDCSNCLIPHSKGGYDYVTGSFMKIVELIQKNQDETP